MRHKPSELVDVRAMCGLGLFLAWREAATSFLYPPSAGLVFSPLVAMYFSCCVVLVLAFVALSRNRASFPSRTMGASVASLVVLTSAFALMAANDVGGLPVAFLAAIFSGVASGLGLFIWADCIALSSPSARLGTALGALTLECAWGFLTGRVMGAFPHGSGLIMFSLVTAGVLLSLVSCAMRLASRSIGPLMMRPSKNGKFGVLLCAVVLYAVVFGVTQGITAEMTTPAGMLVYNIGVYASTTVVTAVLLAILLVAGSSPSLALVGRFLTPALALLFLAHLAFGGSIDGLLPQLTTGFWQLFSIFAFLLLVDVAQAGVASLSFAFPVGWAIVSVGFALGALLGQVLGLAFGDDPAYVQSITIAMTITAIVASSVLGAASYPKVVSPPAAEGTTQGASPAPDKAMTSAAVRVPGAVAACGAAPVSAPINAAGAAPVSGVGSGSSPAPAAQVGEGDAIAHACRYIGSRHGVSDREQEVFELLARGHTRASIAEKLCISENTARVHVRNIYSKLYIHSKQQLIDMVDARVACQDQE